MVMRAKDFVFHMNCFSCCACAKTLLPGDYFGMRDGLVYCRDDYEAIIQGQTLQSLSPGVLGSVPDDIPFYTGTKRVQKGRPRKRKIPPPEGTGYTQRAMGKKNCGTCRFSGNRILLRILAKISISVSFIIKSFILLKLQYLFLCDTRLSQLASNKISDFDSVKSAFMSEPARTLATFENSHDQSRK